MPTHEKCINCKSDLLVDPNTDIVSDRDGKYWVCPVCKQFNGVMSVHSFYNK